MQQVYLAKQPILDKQSHLYAYEILYRDSNKKSNIEGDRHASASVISSILNEFGTKTLLGDKKAFIKIDEKFLLNDIIHSVPKGFFIFSILEGTKFSPRVVERVEQLHNEGYVFAINDSVLCDANIKQYKEILPFLTYIKVDFANSLDENLSEHIQAMHNQGIQLVATKIETQEAYEWSSKFGFDYYEGYYFAEPKILENAKYEASHMSVLKLYNLLMMETSIDDLAGEFEKAPEITVQLLQFINSGAFHFRKKISSIQQILVLLGRITVAKWLMLMIYAKSVTKNHTNNPLINMVRSRTELMERILQEIQPDVNKEMLGEAYFVGVLSLMDVLFSMRIEDILENVNISDEVKDALFEDKGQLGEIYALIRSIEKFDVEKMIAFEKKYNLPMGTVQKIVVESIQEVDGVKE